MLFIYELNWKAGDQVKRQAFVTIDVIIFFGRKFCNSDTMM